MKSRYFFEFMDQDWLLSSLRDCTRDLLRMCNDRPFRSYNSWVGTQTLETSKKENLYNIVELGAGTAPVTRKLVPNLLNSNPNTIKLIPSDMYPDELVFKQLKKQYQGIVWPIFDKTDFSQPMELPDNSAAILSVAFHHIPFEQRLKTIENMTNSAEKVVVFEGLRRTLPSMLFCCLSPIASIIAPIYHINKPGRLRRFLWCWFVPVAPIMFVWDGWVSCLRAWTRKEWQQALDSLGYDYEIKETLISQMVSWSKKK